MSYLLYNLMKVRIRMRYSLINNSREQLRAIETKGRAVLR